MQHVLYLCVMSDDVYIPGPCLNFKVAVMARLLNERYTAAYEGLGLTNEQVRMILNLKQAGEVNQQTLADRLELERSSFSRAIKGMIRKNLVTSSRSRTDKRSILVRLTAKGEKKAAEIFPVWKAIHEESMALFGQATVNEINRMIRILKTTDH